MLSSNQIQKLVYTVSQFANDIKQVGNFIQSLSKDEYASLATAYLLGREGWERNYIDSREYIAFVESLEAEGTVIAQKILDDKFLTVDMKKRQVSLIYGYETTEFDNYNSSGLINPWLSSKTNLVSAANDGVAMLIEIGL